MSDEVPRVFGRYELVRKVATGGMAEIWLARQTGPASFSRQLVLKMILPELATDEGFVEMFLDEAKVSAQLVHPNIAQIYDFGEADGTYYLAMELVRGPNLKRLHWFSQKRRMPLPFQLIAKLVAQAAAGLDHAHRLLGEDGKPLGVIHRDVTPTNMVCAYEGETKVLDFGIARAEQRVTKTQAGVIKGKYAYMSPEQIDGRPLDPRSDVFSLGATLFELTCNERAFPAEGELELVQQICDQDVRSPRSIRPDVPEHLEEIILNAMARDRDQRFRTARALGEALERFAHKQARGPVTKGRVSDYLEALKHAVGDGLDPFALGSGTAAGRTPGPAAALAIREAMRPAAGPGSKGWQEAATVISESRTPGPAGAVAAGRGTPGPVRALAPAALPSPQGTLLGMTAADAGPAPGPGTLGGLPGAASGRSQTVGTGIGRPEPLAFGQTPSSGAIPTLVAEQPGPPRSPSDPQPPPRRQAPVPVVLPVPVELPQAPPGEPGPHAQLPLAEEPTRLRYPGEAPRPAAAEDAVVVADDAEALAFPRRSPAKVAAAILGGAVLLAVVAIVGVRLLGAAASGPAVAPAGGAGAVAPVVPEAAAGEAAAGAGAAAGEAAVPAAAGAPVAGAGAVPAAGQAAAAAPDAKPSGAVMVRVLPYGLVELDGTELGMSPFDSPLVIPAGEHMLVVRNPDNEKSETRKLLVVAGEPLELNFDLR